VYDDDCSAEGGDWLSDGCDVIGWNDTFISCRCPHLSIFAVVVSSSNLQVCTSAGIIQHHLLLGLLLQKVQESRAVAYSQ